MLLLWPTSCLIFSDELCVAQGMGWFDDQLNFDASVSPSVFFNLSRAFFYWENERFLFVNFADVQHRHRITWCPGGCRSWPCRSGVILRLNHLSRRVYICQGRAWLDAWTSWWTKRTRWGWTSAGTRSLMRTRLSLSPCSGYVNTF